MNFLFLTHKFPKGKKNTCLEKDFIKKLIEKGHNVYVATPTERRMKEETNLYQEEGAKILYVKTGNRTKEYNLIEKICTILSTPFLMNKEIKRYFKDIHVDYIVSYTPFMSNLNLIKSLTNYYSCKNVLFLWDIMPQTAKDMGIIKNNLIFNHMKNKEKKLYQYVDKIICNCDEAKNYILKNNYKKEQDILFIRNPEYIQSEDLKNLNLREKYGYSQNEKVFIFGGNMGMLQKLDNLLDLAKNMINDKEIKFLLIGDGKDKLSLEKRVEKEKITNVKILNVVPREEYENLVSEMNAGLICLSEKNTVPNFPTKVTAYLKLGLPMFAMLDKSAAKGVGKYIDDNQIGIWSKAGELEETTLKFKEFLKNIESTKYSKEYLKSIYKKDFDIEKAYEIFIKEIE